MNERKSFVLFLEYAEFFEELTDEQIGKLTRAIFNYNYNGMEPDFAGALKLAWIAIRQGMDRNNELYEKRAAAGRRGGQRKGRASEESDSDDPEGPEPSSEANASKKKFASKSASKNNTASVCFGDSVSERVPVPDRVPVRGNERERVPSADAGNGARTPRGKYGHVLLSDGEIQQLASDCSAGGKLSFTTPEELITTLDEYIHTKPEFKSACHLITLRGWVADKVLEQRQKARPKASASFSASDVKAYEEWGRKKLREA